MIKHLLFLIRKIFFNPKDTSQSAYQKGDDVPRDWYLISYNKKKYPDMKLAFGCDCIAFTRGGTIFMQPTKRKITEYFELSGVCYSRVYIKNIELMKAGSYYSQCF